MKKLYLYNSLTKSREPFAPISNDEVKIYSCGPTVYDFPHIGNYRSFLFSDLLHRTLKAFGYRVKLVMNITDIDDKTIKASLAHKESLKSYTDRYTQAFLQDLKDLQILQASHYPRATDNIKEMIEMIKVLLEKKHAYIADGSVYFRLSTFPNYGKLNHFKLEDQIVGAGGRNDSDEYKKENFSDFVLWKKYQESDGDVFYDSPFGKGRPGWHIECSAMSRRFLGDHFDIHTGGTDNRFPHHENEIAQSECFSGKDFVNYWLHVAHLLVEGEKMSKSLGNFYTLRDLTKRNINPLTLRYMMLSTHYRNPFNFTLEGVSAVEKAIARVNRTVQRLEEQQKELAIEAASDKKSPTEKKIHANEDKVVEKMEREIDRFYQALADDLNTSSALSVLFDVLALVNPLLDKNQMTDKIAKSLTVFLHKVDEIFCFIDFDSTESKIPKDISDLAEKRDEARKNKDYALSDQLRDEIIAKGYKVEDAANKTVVKKHDA
uniref:Cysteine--tRNA ligase n=1 Tax=Magallana gigas TaxID=29159 RepID=K1Q6U6_MAGGI